MATLSPLVRGDTEVINLTIKNGDGTTRNITSDTIKFTIKKNKNDSVPVLQKSVGSGIVKTNSLGGLADVTISPADLTSLSKEQTLYADVEVTDSSGKVATTLHTLNFVLDVST